jgi:hypothetical protein
MGAALIKYTLSSAPLVLALASRITSIKICEVTMLETLKPMIVVSVSAGQVNMLAGLVPTPVSVSDKNEFAIFLS